MNGDEIPYPLSNKYFAFELRRATRRIMGAILIAGDLAHPKTLKYFDEGGHTIDQQTLAKDVQAIMDADEMLVDEP